MGTIGRALALLAATASCGRGYYVRADDYRAPRRLQVDSQTLEVVPARRMDGSPTWLRIDTVQEVGPVDPQTGWRRLGARIGTGLQVAGWCNVGSGLLLVGLSQLVSDDPFVGDELARIYLTFGLLQVGVGAALLAWGYARPEPEVDAGAPGATSPRGP